MDESAHTNPESDWQIAIPESSALSPLAVNSNGHFLTHEDGTPFFWLGDTAWCLFTRSPGEVRLYMENRAAKGFNVIQAMAIRTDLIPQELWKNYRGDSPFESLDPVCFNENYWQHLDFIVDEAARNGLYLALFSMWGRDVNRLFPDPSRNNYDYCERIPDPGILTSDSGSMDKETPTYCVATRAADGSFLFVYTPQGHGFEVDMTKLSGTQAHAWWYNPRDGLCYDMEKRPTDHSFGTCSTQGTQSFSPPSPSGEGRDWVLVLEDTVKVFAPPGIYAASPGVNRQTRGSNHE